PHRCSRFCSVEPACSPKLTPLADRALQRRLRGRPCGGVPAMLEDGADEAFDAEPGGLPWATAHPGASVRTVMTTHGRKSRKTFRPRTRGHGTHVVAWCGSIRSTDTEPAAGPRIPTGTSITPEKSSGWQTAPTERGLKPAYWPRCSVPRNVPVSGWRLYDAL